MPGTTWAAGASKSSRVSTSTLQTTNYWGIAEWYAPESLVGQKIIVVSNLEPRRLRGLESRGMLLAADADGRPMLATVPAETPNGARLR